MTLPGTSNSPITGFDIDIYNLLDKDKLVYVFRGDFSQELIRDLLNITETNLNNVNEPSKVRRKVCSLMVESLQNITKHEDDNRKKEGYFMLRGKAQSYYLTSGNMIKAENVEPFKEKLERVNSLDNDSLKELYKDVIVNGRISEKGGAGLGLIDMARKSGNKLGFSFQDVSEDYSFFYLQTQLKADSSASNAINGHSNCLSEAIRFHHWLEENNIQLFYKGLVTQDLVLQMMRMAEGSLEQMDTDIRKMRFLYVMVEFMQNIFKYGESDADEESDRKAMLSIGVDNNKFNILVGNLVKNSNVSKLDEVFTKVNAMDSLKLDHQFSMNLLADEGDENKRVGSGLVDIRLKTGNKFVYDFFPTDSDLSLFLIQVQV